VDKVLFENEFMALIDRDGYIFSREVRCNGVIVAIVPFRNAMTGQEFLARLEVCPAHGLEQERCCITGGAEPGKPIEQSAQKELLEEAGYRVEVSSLIRLGNVRPSKSADTIVHLFAVNVTGKPQEAALGDGSTFEKGSGVAWVDYRQGLEITDTLFVTAMVRLKELLNGH